MAVETNIRIVAPGPDLYIWTRRASVSGTSITADLMERACGTLRHRHRLAAVPLAKRDEPMLLVASSRPIQDIRLAEQEWEMVVADTGLPPQKLLFSTPDGRALLPTLVERSMLATLASRHDLWTLDSARIWYEEEPFYIEGGIDAYRRYVISGLPVDGVGVGIAVDIGTAFFSEHALDYFFDPDVADAEYRRRANWFARLTDRQKGQKGTLLYDNGQNRVKCYFEDARLGVTCANTGKIRAKGKTYDSLGAYYHEVYPRLQFREDGPAVMVSFRGLDKPQWVAAERLRVRVMNDELPRGLRNVDKLQPMQRREMAAAFWTRVGERPFGWVAPGVLPGFWRPPAARVYQLAIPELSFGKGQRLAPPAQATPEAYKFHYKQRGEYLNHSGCYSIPPATHRTIHFAYPDSLGSEVCGQLARDLTSELHRLTSCAFDFNLVSYASISDAIEQLRTLGKAGTAVFVLNAEPAAYYEVSFQLDDWRIKRLMEDTLRQHYGYLKYGAGRPNTGPLDPRLGRRRWDDMVSKNVLEVLQLLDAVPYRVEQAGPYEAQLTIDVGHDRRYFALSLLLARPDGSTPGFLAVSNVYTKAEHQDEAINHLVLSRQVIALFEQLLPRRSDPLRSLLVVRDGKFCGREIEGLDAGLDCLCASGKLAPDARVDLVDLHKDSQKAVRLWDVTVKGDCEIATNPLEGSAVRLNAHTVVVASTGAATLHQGTAEPFWIVGNGRCSSLQDAAAASFSAAQLNWSSPNTAQKLPLPLKRTDEELSVRAAQEVRRFR